jgi:hypothetical protein
MVKQARQHTSLIGLPPVHIDLHACLPPALALACEHTGVDRLDWDGLFPQVHGFFDQLAAAPTLDQQIKIIQLRKGPIRKKLTEDEGLLLPSLADPSYDAFSVSLHCLLYCYIHPRYELLRKYMEWIVECLIKRTKLFSHTVVRVLECTSGVCERVVYTEFAALFHDVVSTEHRKLDDLRIWLNSLSCMAMIDKDLPWLDVEMPATARSTRLFNFLKLLGSVTDMCVEQYSAHTQKPKSATPSAIEFSQINGCCAEVLKTVMIILKSRKALVLAHDAYFGRVDEPAWLDELGIIAQCSVRCLLSDCTSKDVVTSAAMVLVCIQWLCRNVFVNPNEPDSTVSISWQLRSFASKFSSELTDTTVNSLRESATMIPVVDRLSLGTEPVVHPLARCCVVRALLSVYDAEHLWYVEPGRSPVILAELLDECLSTSRHNLPEVRLYGLQTLETWFTNVLEELKGGDYTRLDDANISALETYLQAISKLLCNVWAHPMKQVNHMVPSLFGQLCECVSLVAKLSAGSK